MSPGRLQGIMASHGSRSVLFSDRGGPFRDLHQAFMRGLGSPNYCNHDVSCARNVHHAALSVFGFGRKDLVYDFKNARHVVLQTRNIFEAINVKEVNDLLEGMKNGCRLTVIDIRSTVSSTKADRFFMLRPGTDYAFNLAVIHVLIRERLTMHPSPDCGSRISAICLNSSARTRPNGPKRKRGCPPERLVAFVRELAGAKPSVVWHPGWMTARYRDSFHVCRSIYLINALLGSSGPKGACPFPIRRGTWGARDSKSSSIFFQNPAKSGPTAPDGDIPISIPGPGLLQLAFQAIQTEDPYPLKAYIAYRHDPLMGFPDPEALKTIFESSICLSR